jgi:hypothetical protein
MLYFADRAIREVVLASCLLSCFWAVYGVFFSFPLSMLRSSLFVWYVPRNPNTGGSYSATWNRSLIWVIRPTGVHIASIYTLNTKFSCIVWEQISTRSDEVAHQADSV